MEGKDIKIVFYDDVENIHYINAFEVIKGADDYFIKLGGIVPSTLPAEEIEKLEKIEAKPLFAFAMTKSGMKEFIKLLQSEYEKDE